LLKESRQAIIDNRHQRCHSQKNHVTGRFFFKTTQYGQD
jgi:hypothetical protein